METQLQMEEPVQSESAVSGLIEQSLQFKLDPSKETIIVLGGSGFLGSSVCKSAVLAGYNVISISKKGRCPLWMNPEKKKWQWSSKVNWCIGDALHKSTLKPVIEHACRVCRPIPNQSSLSSINNNNHDSDADSDAADNAADDCDSQPSDVVVPAHSVRGIVCAMGGWYWTKSKSERMNGECNINAITLAKEYHLPRALYLSGWYPKKPHRIYNRPLMWIFSGYYRGRLNAERVIKEEFGDNGISLRCGSVSGTRYLFWGKFPLWMSVPYFFTGYVFPSVKLSAVGDASIRFFMCDDPFPEEYIDNRDIVDFCVL